VTGFRGTRNVQSGAVTKRVLSESSVYFFRLFVNSLPFSIVLKCIFGFGLRTKIL
jgi:hypothetical protein